MQAWTRSETETGDRPSNDRRRHCILVSVFDKPHWRSILNTKDRGEAEAPEQAMVQDGVKAKIEEITPKGELVS